MQKHTQLATSVRITDFEVTSQTTNALGAATLERLAHLHQDILGPDGHPGPAEKAAEAFKDTIGE